MKNVWTTAMRVRVDCFVWIPGRDVWVRSRVDRRYLYSVYPVKAEHGYS